MAIQSASEFEAKIAHVVATIEKTLIGRGDDPKLDAARGELQHLLRVSRDGAKLKAARAKLDALSDFVGGEIPALLDDLWDLLDYIDYRA